MAIGVTMTELRVTGESGGTSTSFGRRSPAPGQSHFIAPTAPAPAITTTISAPVTILLNGHCMPSRPSCAYRLSLFEGSLFRQRLDRQGTDTMAGVRSRGIAAPLQSEFS